jgi:hypothetical protein
MNQSILQSTKKNLGVAPEYQAFDLDIITYINAALSTLEQLGVGPVGGFAIQDEMAEWGDLLGGDPRLNNVPTYVFLRAKLLFDPPQTSFHLTAIEKQIEQMEWRLSVLTDPDRPPTTVDIEL